MSQFKNNPEVSVGTYTTERLEKAVAKTYNGGKLKHIAENGTLVIDINGTSTIVRQRDVKSMVKRAEYVSPNKAIMEEAKRRNQADIEVEKQQAIDNRDNVHATEASARRKGIPDRGFADSWKESDL